MLEIRLADASCINQENLVEKAEQVRMMGDIYERAESVYIWLGVDEEQDQHILEMMEHICRLELVSPDDLQGTSRLDSPSFKLENYPRETFVGMSAFLHWPWFWRAWVFQEYHRVRHRVFRRGALIIPCETLSGTIEKMGRYFTLKSLIVGFGQPPQAHGITVRRGHYLTPWTLSPANGRSLSYLRRLPGYCARINAFECFLSLDCALMPTSH